MIRETHADDNIPQYDDTVSLGKNFRPALRLWGERPDVHLLKRHFGSSVAIWLITNNLSFKTDTH